MTRLQRLNMFINGHSNVLDGVNSEPTVEARAARERKRTKRDETETELKLLKNEVSETEIE